MSFIQTIKSGAVLLLATVMLLFSAAAVPNGEHEVYNWYVKRNTEHRQPTIDRHQGKLDGCNAIYVDSRHGDETEEKVLYLTFDAGYENGNIEKIIDVLKAENAPAAFFVLKNIVEKHPNLIKRMESEGHLVCNHTMTHRDTTTLSEEEFKRELNGLAALCEEKTGVKMAHYYRPPEGRYNAATLKFANELGYTTVFWSFAYADWDNNKQPKAEEAKRKILDNTHNGAIILLHPNSETNAMILSDLIRTWREQGYRLASLSELDE